MPPRDVHNEEAAALVPGRRQYPRRHAWRWIIHVTTLLLLLRSYKHGIEMGMAEYNPPSHTPPNPTKAKGESKQLITCELPNCELVRQSRIYSERCEGNSDVKWQLLITATPRSATVFTQSSLLGLGMQIENDWKTPKRDGSVSWIFAFEDERPFGPDLLRPIGGKKFRHVLHQVKEPLSSITSLCTEPLANESYSSFLKRHIPLESYQRNDSAYSSQTRLEFWLQWHTFLVEMKFPTYKIEDVDLRDIFEISGMSHLYRAQYTSDIASKSNSRKHRSKFTWQEVYTMDPLLAADAWRLAHQFGYSYPGVDFDRLTCLEAMPSCKDENTTTPSDKCPPFTHPHSTNMSDMKLSPLLDPDLGFKGWVDSGCVEHKIVDSFGNVTYLGIRGLLRREDLQQVISEMDPTLFGELNRTAITKRFGDGRLQG